MAAVFFFNDTAATEIYTLSLHDALPISASRINPAISIRPATKARTGRPRKSPLNVRRPKDRKSTRLNSSHVEISYAVFCLKKKKTSTQKHTQTNSRYRESRDGVPAAVAR